MDQHKTSFSSVEVFAAVTGFYACFTVSLQAYSVTFLAPSITFECAQWPNETQITGVANHSSCEGHCEKWEYDHSEFTSTLTEKLDLVCDNSWLISFGNSMNMAGDTLGCLIFGHMADRFGRRPILLGCAVFAVFSHLLILFQQDVITFIIGRFFTGTFSYGVMNSVFIFAAEIFQAKYRSAAVLTAQCGWTFAQIILCGLAYVNRNWFYTQLIITILACLLPIFIWFNPESPRWLMQKGKLTEGEVINFNAKYNAGIQKKTDVDYTASSRTETSILDLFKTPNIRKWSLMVFFYWLTIGFTYFGISLNSGIFGSNLFLNFFLNGIVEFPSFLITLIMARYVKRKTSLIIYMVGAGISLFLVIAVANGENWLLTFFVVSGKFFITAAFFLAYIYTAEMFPTIVRAIGFGSSSMCCRIGSILAPFVKEMSEAAGLWVPMALFGVLCLISALLVHFLPETKDVILPDTLEEAENYESAHKTKGHLDLTATHHISSDNYIN